MTVRDRPGADSPLRSESLDLEDEAINNHRTRAEDLDVLLHETVRLGRLLVAAPPS